MMYYLIYLSEFKYTEQEWKKIRIDQRKIRSLKIVIYLIISREDDRDWTIFA